jgi:F-type H+-transporting ATPase subunit delta
MAGAIATRYAEAMAEAVLAPAASQDPHRTAGEIRAFEALVNASPDLRTVLLSPAVSTSKKRTVVARFADTLPLSRLVRNLLYVIIDHRRADILGEIAEAFENSIDERMGFVRAEVTSAAPLSDSQKTAIQEALSKTSGKRVRCKFHTDPELIGGVVARIGSTVYDGSVRTQLESIRQRLVS